MAMGSIKPPLTITPLMSHPRISAAADAGEDFLSADDIELLIRDGGVPEMAQDLSVSDYGCSSPSHPDGAVVLDTQPPHEDAGESFDLLFHYIDRMLMAEDIDLKFEHYPESYPAAAVLEAQRPFLEILSQSQAPPLSNVSSGSPNDSACNSGNSASDCIEQPALPASFDESFNWTSDLAELLNSTPAVDAQPLTLSSTDVSSNDLQWLDSMLLSSPAPAPAGAMTDGQRQTEVVSHRVEVDDHHCRKHSHRDEVDDEALRRHKQMAVNSEELVMEMMNKVLLSNGEACSSSVRELRESLQSKTAKSKRSGRSKERNKKTPAAAASKKEVVDLDTLLLHCAQAVATDDRRSALQYLKQLRQHSSPSGNGDERVAHCFAEGLEARLAGTGSHLYNSFLSRRFACTDILKAYQLLLAACPFKKISHMFSDLTILDHIDGAKKVHIIDYGIYYGFQWPCFIQRLARLPGGPPRLRITGIDLPQPGLRPGERLEETGRQLRYYAHMFGVEFDYRPIPCKWESLEVEDFGIEDDEAVIVNSLFKFQTLVDESVVAASPRDTVLRTIRRLRPRVFVHGAVNGSYNAPFFVTRFKEALFHFSALFDMLEANVPAENDEPRRLLEWGLFGREAMNVISCEGVDRMERPETYKQWHARLLKAGMEQLPLSAAVVGRAMEKVRNYHKDYIVDDDQQWLLQGWKGRILYALSAWKPTDSPATSPSSSAASSSSSSRSRAADHL